MSDCRQSDTYTPGIADEALLRRAVHQARGPGRGYVARWVAVMDLFMLGSTYARGLCLRFDLDPDERVRRNKS